MEGTQTRRSGGDAKLARDLLFFEGSNFGSVQPFPELISITCLPLGRGTAGMEAATFGKSNIIPSTMKTFHQESVPEKPAAPRFQLPSARLPLSITRGRRRLSSIPRSKYKQTERWRSWTTGWSFRPGAAKCHARVYSGVSLAVCIQPMSSQAEQSLLLPAKTPPYHGLIARKRCFHPELSSLKSTP